MRVLTAGLLLGALTALGARPILAQTSYPMLTHVHPVAVQRGTTAEVQVDCQMSLFGAYQVLIEGEGVTAEVIPAAEPKVDPPQRPQVRNVKIKVAAAKDAPLGVREFRIATSLGVSSVGQLLVCDFPVVPETANNNTPDKATALAVPCVACGKIEALEDVDWYQFKAEAGQTITLAVHCARIQDKIHDLQKHADPLIVLTDAAGKELASNDDFYFADPMLSYRIEKGGEYRILVRDSKYDGDARWVYALTVTNQPYASHVFPLAVYPGETAELEPVGSAKLVRPIVEAKIPKDAVPGIRLLDLDLGGKKTNPVAVLVTPDVTAPEVEPNDTPETATRIPIPCGINARIVQKRDLDHFVFSAEKGKALRFEVKARRFGTELMSGLDASIDILDKKGAVLATGDDISPAIKDAAVNFTPPADGDYILRVRDLLSKGGEHFVYAVEVSHVAQDFTLRVDGDKAMIGPGSSAAWYVHLTRLNGFVGPVQVEVKGLPKGVTANPLVIPPTMTQGLLVLTADADAPRCAANVKVVGTARAAGLDGKEVTLTRTATPHQEIYSPGGGRARFDVNLQTVGVTDKSDIERVEVSPPTITLKPGQEVKIDVKVKRRADFDGPVTLDVKLRHLGQVYGDPLPPGVTMEDGKSKTLLGKASDGHIILKVAPNAAPIENVPISVVANVSVNFVVKIAYSSPPIPVSVTLPSK
jgi:hypothetical protein